MSTHCFEDADHASENFTGRRQTGILIFCNQALVLWRSKKQNPVKTSTFGSKFTAFKLAIELVISLQYKLSIFVVPLKGPNYVFCDNEKVFKNTSTPDYV